MSRKKADRKPTENDNVIHSTFRAEEMRWLWDHEKELNENYPGEWLALDGPRLVAHGRDLLQVIEEAKAKGVENPFFSSVRAKEYQGRRVGPWFVVEQSDQEH